MVRNLDELRRRARQQWDAMARSAAPRILVGTATCGRAVGALETLQAIEDHTRQEGIECTIVEVGCLGLCYAEPVVSIVRPPWPMICYGRITPEVARALVDRVVRDGDPASPWALGSVGEGRVEGIPSLFETPVFRGQVRRTLGNCGFLDPGQIDHYLAQEGYRGLERALHMAPDEVLDEVRRSGLRGKGGAGFPTWRKWKFARDAPGAPKYVICNASEGDPGVYHNKLLLESDPHRVLEGMLIAGYAVGAEEGYIYCPARSWLALRRLRAALRQMERCGLLGEKILGASFDFHIKIKEGAGSYVCGEETALIECLEGKRGMPRLRPPFPPVTGLWARSTVVNNVETLAAVALILHHGASWFADVGTENNRGTKVLCLSGNVERGGVIEVPLGTPLRHLVEAIGGGPPGGKRLKAVQCGGPGGGCLPPSCLDTPADHDSLLPLGASLGSGGVVVLDETVCLVDLAHNTAEFACRESCGQCVPCRLGTRQVLEISRDIVEGRGKPADLDLLVDLAEGIRLGSLCAHGQTALKPLLSALGHFRDEFEAHVREARCPAGVCSLESCPSRQSEPSWAT
ncbi:MAG: SLBB domain-containing protein [Thermoguttaceae bacterium]|jgi:NADH-quinone oxidoreductase subunit F|nr:SLBB domain-containing protein [Thermoguttaceae bacterium]